MTSDQRRLVMRILILTLVVLVGLVAWLHATSDKRGARPAMGFITHFRPGASRIGAGMVTVTARTADGIYGKHAISANELLDRHCRIGDQVTGQVVGIAFRFDARSCSSAKAGGQPAR